MGLWDMFRENVIEPGFSLVFDGVEAVGTSIDKVVTTGIEVVGGGIDAAVDVVKEVPIDKTAIVAATVLGGSMPLLARGLAGNAAKSLIDNHLRDRVKPRVGSVVYCDLAFVAEHSGIYVGKGKIAHLDGSGRIEIVTARQFLNRLGGMNPALSIYVSCDSEGAIKSSKVAKRAREMAGSERSYNVILDNCHQFTSGCLTGNFDNSDNFLWMLKHTAAKKLDVTTWRVWDLKS